MGDTDFFKPQNSGEVVVLAKSAILPTNLPPCARSMNDMAPLRHEICVRSRDTQKQLARTSLSASNEDMVSISKKCQVSIFDKYWEERGGKG